MDNHNCHLESFTLQEACFLLLSTEESQSLIDRRELSFFTLASILLGLVFLFRYRPTYLKKKVQVVSNPNPIPGLLSLPPTTFSTSFGTAYSSPLTFNDFLRRLLFRRTPCDMVVLNIDKAKARILSA